MALRSLVSGLALLAGAVPLAAQQHDHAAPPVDPAQRVRFGAHAVPLATHLTPIVQGRALTEAYVTQPTLFGAAMLFGGAVRVDGTVSLEALTIERGELNAGAYGEGYSDRRHPHTYLHELVVHASRSVGPVSASLALGRGFAPFGTDDPMMRPFVKFPVNHHLGQVLERLVAIGGVRAGPLMIEAGLFNGNEPLDAKDLGSLDRFGDSWSARATLFPLRGVELQASRAQVVSPELPVGGAWDQRKWSVAARYSGALASGSLYGLAEWKRTTEVDRGRDVFSFGSVLAEAMVDFGGWRPALRVERSDRPEEQRLGSQFRTPWPHGGGHVLGITRWTIGSARLERAVELRGVRVAPFVEASLADVSRRVEGPFDPAALYGGTRIRTFNIGARLGAGHHPARMGRYGVAMDGPPLHSH